MAEHVWSVLCRRGVVDRDGGQVSLHEVIEKVILQNPSPDALQALEGKSIHSPMDLVTWWVRSDFSVPEEPVFRVRIIGPKETATAVGERHTSEEGLAEGVEIPLDLKNYSSFRRRMRVEGVPWAGEGRYWFQVERPAEDGSWTIATRLPLEVEIKREAEERSEEKEEPGQL